MLRRQFNWALCFLALAPYARPANISSRGPLFWLASRGKARVFVLGFGEANATDESWFTPSIRSAFRDSSELWLEVAPPEAPGSRSAVEKAEADAEYEKLAHESGRTFFDDLEPQVRERTLAYMAELGIKKESVETLHPWWAYYTINSAFWSRTKLPCEPVNVDEVLRKQATNQGKRVRFEMPSGLAFARFMAGMPDKAQSQYIEWLLDFLDEYKKGVLDTATSGWIAGNPVINQRSLDRMRTKMPELYQAMQVQRNTWWAHKIDELLATNDTYFVAVGELHVLGPDGIPSQLQRLRIVGPSGLRENPISR